MTYLHLLPAIIETFLMVLGLVFWMWGTLPILNKKHSLFYKLHTLTVADTVGSLCMLLAMVIHAPQNWVLILTAAISLSLWNTFFSYILGGASEKQ